MTEVQENLLSLLANVLFGRNCDTEVNNQLMKEAKEHAVSTLIGSDYKTLGNNIRVISAHSELSSLLEGIPFTTFKGYSSAYYYPQPFYRPMGDVDFIVASDRYEEAVERLTASGFTKTTSEHERHETFRKGKISFELHSEIKGIPNGADGIMTHSATAEEKVRALLVDLIPTARIVTTQQGEIVIPDDFHHGLIMLLHVAGHMINDGGVGLRHLCDWAVYVNRVDVGAFRNQLEDIGLWTFACQLTAVSSTYLGLPKQTWAGDWPDQFLAALINEILSSGNFGNKKAGRVQLATIKRTSYAEMTRKHYPAANNPILLPLFMVIFVVRYCCLVLAGKRRFIKPSTVLGTKARYELYLQFRLFEG